MRYCLFLLLTWAWLSSQAQAQAPRLVLERVFSQSAAGQPAYFVDGQRTQQDLLIVCGTRDLGPLAYYQNRTLLLTATLDTVWTAAGREVPLGPQRLVVGPGSRYSYCSQTAGSRTGQADLGLQTLTPTGRSVRSVALANPENNERLFGGALSAADGGLYWGSTPDASRRRRVEFLRTDSTGTVQWRRAYGWSNGDYQVDLVYTNTATVLLAGITLQPGVSTPTWGLRLLEVNSQGDSLRGVVLAPRGPGRTTTLEASYNRLLPLADGGLLLPCQGDTTIDGVRFFQPMLLKVDRQLQPQWVGVARFRQGLRYTGAVALADGSVLVLMPAGPVGFYLHHYGPQGQWRGEYTFPSRVCTGPEPIKLLPDASGRRLFVIGGCRPSTEAYAAVLDLGGLASAVTATTPPTAATAPPLLQVYPSPAAGAVTVQVSRAGTLRLLDALGRVVARQPLRAGPNRLDVAALPAGLYACQLVQDGRVVAVQRLQIAR